MLHDHKLQTSQRRRFAYTLVEVLADGSQLRDSFAAPGNSEAIARAQDVIEGKAAELWRGRQLVHRWEQLMLQDRDGACS